MSRSLDDYINEDSLFGEGTKSKDLPFGTSNDLLPQVALPSGQDFMGNIQKIGGLLLIILFVSGSLVLLGLKATQKESDVPSKLSLTESSEASPVAETIVVDLGGAVEKSGIYHLSVGSRLSDLIEAGGGLSDTADPAWVTKNVNLAGKLSDGQKVYIPAKKEILGMAGTTGSPITGGTVVLGVVSAKININTAPAALLDTLPGIGPSTAEKIIKYRETSGRFQRIDDIQRVSGIKSATFSKIKDLITVD